MRILIIDNTIDKSSWGSPELVRFAKSVSGATVIVRRAPEGDLPESPASFDRVILSGSKTSANDDAPWIFRLHEFVRATIGMKKPFLGVCYGHQTLIRALGDKTFVRRGEHPEFGWSEIEILQQAPLLKGLPKKFYTYSSHFDEAASLPNGFHHLARSKLCEIQAVQLEDRPVFGIQFHPEKNLEEAKKSLEERKKTGTPKTLLHPGKGESEKLFDPAVGEKIFGNFLSL